MMKEDTYETPVLVLCSTLKIAPVPTEAWLLKAVTPLVWNPAILCVESATGTKDIPTDVTTCKFH